MVTEVFNVNGFRGGDVLEIFKLTVDDSPVDINPSYSIQNMHGVRWVPLAPTLKALSAAWKLQRMECS